MQGKAVSANQAYDYGNKLISFLGRNGLTLDDEQKITITNFLIGKNTEVLKKMFNVLTERQSLHVYKNLEAMKKEYQNCKNKHAKKIDWGQYMTKHNPIEVFFCAKLLDYGRNDAAKFYASNLPEGHYKTVCEKLIHDFETQENL